MALTVRARFAAAADTTATDTMANGTLVAVVFGALGVALVAIWWRRRPPRRGVDRLWSERAQDLGILAFVLFCLVAVIVGLTGGGIPRWLLLLGCGLVLGVAATGLLAESVLKWWEPRADRRYRRRTGLPEGDPIRWRWTTVATFGAVGGVVLAGIVFTGAVVLVFSIDRESAPRWLTTVGMPLFAVLVVGLAALGAAAGGLVQSRRIRRDRPPR